mmetsp:Transcript_2151/g.5406  ORF Transcript_2151/g.5406 Transcript_2151/m.5406 type:complete len:429 (-) Transcript_2151:29-1315(-)
MSVIWKYSSVSLGSALLNIKWRCLTSLSMALLRFTKTLLTKAVKVPTQLCNSLIKANSKCLLNRPKLKNVWSCEENDSRLLVLNEDLEKVPESLEQYEVRDFEVKLGYEHLSANEALKALLPPDIPIPTGFETVGQLAHFNLKEVHMPYRHLIGEVVKDKSHVRTVVTKLGNITNTFRTFDMEVIAGEHNTEVEVKEGACNFVFDFAKVYWSSKLQHERDIVLSELQPGQVVCDMFAGIGPFALRAAKQGNYVIANDLNPEGAAGLRHNAIKNKVAESVAIFNLDAREFIRQLVNTPREDVQPEALTPPMAHLPATFHHVYMNLPKDAIEFLDVFQGLFDASVWGELPILHVYGFSNADDPDAEFLERIAKVWGEIEIPDFRIRRVRDISTRKFVFCLSFTIPREVAFAPKKRQGDEIDEGVQKRPAS